MISSNATKQTVPTNAQSICAPDKDLKISLWLDNGVPYYAISSDGIELVNASKMGIETSNTNLCNNFKSIKLSSTSSQDKQWDTLVGERKTITDKYNAGMFKLEGDGTEMSIEVKAYNTGIAFRYLLPGGEYTISSEQTEINFSKKGEALCHENGQQTAVKKHRISRLPKKARLYAPLTAVFDNGKAITATVSKVDNFAFPILNATKDGGLKPIAQEVTINSSSQVNAPYWTFVVGDELKDLVENKDIILNLNSNPNEEKYHFGEWVKPGKALMLGLFNETTDTLHDYIDTASDCGLDYVILDFGWYGPEFDQMSDPRLDPSKLVENANDTEDVAKAKAFMRQYVTADGVFDASSKPFNVYSNCPWGGEIMMSPNLNIPEIVKYAKTKDIGIFLYVNGVQLFDKLDRFTIDELFAQFESWGVAGVKPGFVPDKSQENETNAHTIVETAARHHLLLTVHDDWLQSGLEREYPNLLSVEGVFGDEGLEEDDIEGDLNSLFARGIQGVTDHTICYPGKASRGFQLAESVLWQTGLTCVYWPWKNTDTENLNTIKALPKQEKQFWKNMPSTWDDTIAIKAELSKSAVTARKTGDEWYVGAISATTQDLEIPFDFLDDDKQYTAEIYCDTKGSTGKSINRDNANARIEYIRLDVNSESTFTRKLKKGTGVAIHIVPKSQA